MGNWDLRGLVEYEKVAKIPDFFLVFKLFHGLLVKTRTTDQFYLIPRMILREVKYSRYVNRTFEQLKKSRGSKVCKFFLDVKYFVGLRKTSKCQEVYRKVVSMMRTTF